MRLVFTHLNSALTLGLAFTVISLSQTDDLKKRIEALELKVVQQGQELESQRKSMSEVSRYVNEFGKDVGQVEQRVRNLEKDRGEFQDEISREVAKLRDSVAFQRYSKLESFLGRSDARLPVVFDKQKKAYVGRASR